MELLFFTILILFFAIALICGTPLFLIIGGGAAVLFKLAAETSMTIVIIEMGRLARAPGITAIPLFIFAGFIFAESKASSRLITFSNSLLGWMPGGLAVVTVAVCTLFTALTGGSGITIIAVGGILLPALVRNGFSPDFSQGLITASGSSGVLFLPSLPIIIYGMVTETDIGMLFIASALPGTLIVLLLSGYGIFHGVRNKVPTTPFSYIKVLEALNGIKWVLPLPFVVVGGIYGGYTTVSEAAAVTAVYALITECLIYREISVSKLVDIAIESMTMVGAILIILGTALALTNFMVDREIPQTLMEMITSTISSKVVFLIGLNIFLLITGCLMDIFSAIVIVAPLVAPVAAQFQIDPLHLGVIFLANLEIGYLTPPVGINLFISSLRFKIPVVRLYTMVIPFLLLLIGALIIISYWPQLSLFLPGLTGRQSEPIMI